ncbi:hypothetical protein [Mesorhizobium sp. M0809]
MHCSVAKFVVDAEQCVMAYRMAEGPKWTTSIRHFLHTG